MWRHDGVRRAVFRSPRRSPIDLSLEDGRTLRWQPSYDSYGYHDLRTLPCPGHRSAFKPLLATDRIALTRAHYGYESEGVVVIRGCDLATHRDRVIAQMPEAYPDDSILTVAGIDRTWVAFTRLELERGDDCSARTVETFDVAGGAHPRPVTLATSTCSGPGLPSPAAGQPLAITARGTPVWISGAQLIAARDGTAVVLDSGGEIAGLRAAGDAVFWTHDGVERSVVP